MLTKTLTSLIPTAGTTKLTMFLLGMLLVSPAAAANWWERWQPLCRDNWETIIVAAGVSSMRCPVVVSEEDGKEIWNGGLKFNSEVEEAIKEVLTLARMKRMKEEEEISLLPSRQEREGWSYEEYIEYYNAVQSKHGPRLRVDIECSDGTSGRVVYDVDARWEFPIWSTTFRTTYGSGTYGIAPTSEAREVIQEATVKATRSAIAQYIEANGKCGTKP